MESEFVRVSARSGLFSVFFNAFGCELRKKQSKIGPGKWFVHTKEISARKSLSCSHPNALTTEIWPLWAEIQKLWRNLDSSN